MRVGIPKEITAGEKRVALVPDAVSKLIETGIEVLVESKAGDNASFYDYQYEKAGATIMSESSDVFEIADVILKVQCPRFNNDIGRHEAELFKNGALLIAFFQPLTNLDLVNKLVEQNVNVLSMDLIPRIARAQKMDALSSMASISGYKATLMAAYSCNKFFPMMVTAAGTYAPARGLVMGAGVAGLQALATGRRLGAKMYGYDIRHAVKEQVESLGGTFIETQITGQTETDGGYAQELAESAQDNERNLIHHHLKDMDFVITTASIPGRPAPILITEDMVSDMSPGSVIIDIAAETGGNCELTKPGETVVASGVEIHGPLNLASTMPTQSSQMYSRNIYSLLMELSDKGELNLDLENPILHGSCVIYDGNILHSQTRELLESTHSPKKG